MSASAAESGDEESSLGPLHDVVDRKILDCLFRAEREFARIEFLLVVVEFLLERGEIEGFQFPQFRLVGDCLRRHPLALKPVGLRLRFRNIRVGDGALRLVFRHVLVVANDEQDVLSFASHTTVDYTILPHGKPQIRACIWSAGEMRFKIREDRR